MCLFKLYTIPQSRVTFGKLAISSSRDSPRFIELEVCHSVHKGPPPMVCILNQIKSVYILTPYIFEDPHYIYAYVFP
jgi:hypothetical protein